MRGNVAELVWDYYGVYPDRMQIDPSGPANGTFRGLDGISSIRGRRGGAYFHETHHLRAARRGAYELGQRTSETGFRLARTAFDSWGREVGEGTCWDGVVNGAEDDIDCGGGLCKLCTCTNGVRDGHETDTDCGGRTESEEGHCDPCPEFDSCNHDSDCEYESSCLDGVCNSCLVADYEGGFTTTVFHFCPALNTWAAAVSDCERRGGILASISTIAENDWGYDNATTVSGRPFWIGLNDEVVEGEYRWEGDPDGAVLERIPWVEGQPDGGSGENCVEAFGTSRRWSDSNCSLERGYICRLVEPD
jgi:hypothetical protein